MHDDNTEAFEGVWRKLDLLGREVPPAVNHFIIFTEERLAMTETPGPEAPPDPVLESMGWPWYEARLSVHVRESKPSDAFGEGGEELAHTRAWTQAPDFPSAIERLDGDLAKNWSQITTNAVMVDQPPSPEVLPRSPTYFSRTTTVRAWLLTANLLLAVVMFLVIFTLVTFG